MVSAGVQYAASGMSSNPTTDRSCGTVSPRRLASLIAPSAIRSDEQITPVGRGPSSSRPIALAPPAGPYGACSISSTPCGSPASSSATAQPVALSRAGIDRVGPDTKPIRPVPELGQVPGGEVAGGLLVHPDVRHLQRRHPAVDEHHVHALGLQLPVVVVRGRARRSPRGRRTPFPRPRGRAASGRTPPPGWRRTGCCTARSNSRGRRRASPAPRRTRGRPGSTAPG